MKKSIFVSSTFKDFQVERELILRRVEKEINDELQNENIGVNFVDLRWGIDTQEGGLKKVITFCIDYVNQSKPYFLILLGDSYGSLVSKDLLKPIYTINNLKYDGKEKSVTEVEIESSLLFEGDNERKIVLKREITNLNKEESSLYFDKENHEKLDNLKEKILSVIDDKNVYSYKAHLEGDTIVIDNEERFVEFLKSSIVQMIRNDFKEFSKNQFDYEIDRLNASYVEGKEIYEIKNNIYDSINNEERYYIIQGNPGIGKSSVASRLKSLIKEDNNEAILYLLEEDKDLIDLEIIVQKMLKEINVLAPDVFEALQQLDKNKKYFFIIDSSDQIVDGNQFEIFTNPNVIPDNVYFVMLVTNSENYEYDYELKELEEDDISRIIENELKLNQKQVPQSFLYYLNKNLNRLQHFRNPSLLSLFINDLCHLSINEYEVLGRREDFMSSLSALFMYKLDSFPKSIDEYLDQISEEALLVFQLLALSNEGLDEEDIRSITWDLRDTYDVGLIRSVIFEFNRIIKKLDNGKYIISNKLVKDAVLKSLNEKEIKFARYQIISSIGARISKLSYPVVKEIIYQYFLLEDYEGLASIISVAYGIFNEVEKLKLGRYLQILSKEVSVNKCEDTYLQISERKIGRANAFLVNYALNDLSDVYIENSLELFSNLYKDIENQDKKYDSQVTYYYISSLISNLKFKESYNLFQSSYKKYLNYGIFVKQLKVNGYQFDPSVGQTILQVCPLILEDKKKYGYLPINDIDLYDLVETIVLAEGNMLSYPQESFDILFKLIHEYYLDKEKRNSIYKQTMNMLKYLSLVSNGKFVYPYDEIDEFFVENNTLTYSRECAKSTKHLLINEYIHYMNDEEVTSDNLINIFDTLFENETEMSINDYLITYKIFNVLSLMEELDYEFLIDVFLMYSNHLGKYFKLSLENSIINVKYLNSILNVTYYSYLFRNKEKVAEGLTLLKEYINIMKRKYSIDRFNNFFNSEVKYYFMDIEGLEQDKEFERFIYSFLAKI